MVCTREARQSGRPGGFIHSKIHGGRSMPEAVLNTTGKPTMREAHHRDPHTHGSQSLPEAILFAHGKPDRAGGLVMKYTVRYTEAGLCRRPYCIQLGSPTMREAHSKDQHRHGRRSRPEAILCVQGKPD